MLACVSGTIFGRAVVPEVSTNKRNAAGANRVAATAYPHGLY